MYGTWVPCPHWLERSKTFPLCYSAHPWALCCFLYFCYTDCKIKHFGLFRMLSLFGTKRKYSGFHLTGKNKWRSEEWNGETWYHNKDLAIAVPTQQSDCSDSLFPWTPLLDHPPASNGQLFPFIFLAVLACGNVLASAAVPQHTPPLPWSASHL